MASARAYELALLRAPRVGPVRFSQLIRLFGSAQAVFTAGREAWTAHNVPSSIMDYLACPDWAGVEQDLCWLEQPDHHFIALDDAGYPPLLKQITYPPSALFVQGDVKCLRRYQLAIVGTRRPTASGRQIAFDFAAALAHTGLVITSGLALGVDAEAHRGALQAGGQTVAVLGSGIDRLYPPQHQPLAQQIAGQGALVSEFSPGTPPMADHFPRRNRLISGLSLGVLVVEAGTKSGALITARYATETGREVFALPGSIHNPMARGCHQLIRQGAKLVEQAEDILEELGSLSLAMATLHYPAAHSPASAATPHTLPTPELDALSQRVLAAMCTTPISVDALVEASGLTVEMVSSMLTLMELQGIVAATPGGLYSRLV